MSESTPELTPIGDAAGICGGDDECFEVLRDVWLFLDNEMDSDARAAVQRHLDDCSPCLEEAGVEEKLKKLVQRTCSGERAPEELRLRVVTALTREGTTLMEVRESSEERTVEGDRETFRIRETMVRIQENPDH